jgi:hypothetical protein
MKKNSYAISFALIGVGIAIWMATDFEWDIEFSALIGGVIGMFAGFMFSGLRSAKGTMLQENFTKLGTLTGLSLSEIEAKCGKSKGITTCNITNRNNEPGYIVTWSEENYQISLLFDAEYKCICVNNETKLNS